MVAVPSAVAKSTEASSEMSPFLVSVKTNSVVPKLPSRLETSSIDTAPSSSKIVPIPWDLEISMLTGLLRFT